MWCKWVRRGISVEFSLLLVPLEREELLVGLELVLAEQGGVLAPELRLRHQHGLQVNGPES